MRPTPSFETHSIPFRISLFCIIMLQTPDRRFFRNTCEAVPTYLWIDPLSMSKNSCFQPAMSHFFRYTCS